MTISEALEPRRLFAAGDLDPTYGNNGTLTFPYVPQVGSHTTAYATVAQGDGKVILVGSTDPLDNGNTDFFLARFRADGVLDRSFGLNGVVRTDFAGGADVAYGVAVAPGGKIVVVGSTVEGSETEVGVARYNPNGTLDTTFSDDGIRSTGYAGRADVAYGVAIDAAGKIVLAGASGSDILLGRLNPSGTNDTSFNGDGLDQAGLGGTEAARAVALRANGQIVAAGSTTNGIGGSDFAVVLYDPSGTRVAAFGSDGKRKVDIAGGFDEGWGVAVDSVGRIVVGGTSRDATDTPFLAGARLNPANGALDTSFSSDGVVTFATHRDQDGPVAHGGGVLVAAGDAVVLAGGWTTIGFPEHFFGLARFTSTGTLDSTFQNGPREDPELVGLAPAPGGKMLLAFPNFSVARRNADGGVDSTFGTDNRKAVLPGIRGSDELNDITFLSDGRAMAAGVYLGEIMLVRYAAGGAIDTTFGNNGRALASLPQTNPDPEQRLELSVSTIALQPGGKFLVAGTLFDQRGIGVGGGVVRFNADGTLDTGFGGGTGVLHNFGTDDSFLSTLRVLGDGKFIFGANDAGQILNYNRYDADGTSDASFHGFSIDPGDSQVSGSLTVLPDGKLLGRATDDGRPDGVSDGPTTVIFRRNADGTPDTTFSGDGFVTDFSGENVPGDEVPGDAKVGGSLTVQSDGKILLLYRRRSQEFGTPTDDMGLIRFTSTGGIDGSFGNGGTVTFDFGGNENTGVPLVQSDGRILISANIDDIGPFDPNAVLKLGFARVNANGTPDESFGSGGAVIHTFGAGERFGGFGPINGDRARIARSARPTGTGFKFSQLDITSSTGGTDPTTPSIAITGGVLVGRGTGGNDTITIRRVLTDDVVVTINGTSKQFDMDDFAGGVRLEGLGGADRITVTDSLNTPVARRVTLDGGNGNDTLTGNDGADLLLGGEGDDSLVGKAGNDTLNGGNGTDFADGDGGSNTHVSIEQFAGGAASISILSRVLTATGTANADTITIERTGTDDVIVKVGTLSKQFDMDDFDTVLLQGMGGNDVITIKHPITAGSITRKVTLDGGAGNDSLTGNAGDDVLRGGDGDDTLIGLGGRDALSGQAGNDQLFGGLGLDFLDGGDNDDFIDSSDSVGGDTVLGGNGSDTAKVDAGDSTSTVETFA